MSRSAPETEVLESASARGVTVEAFEAMSEEEQAFLREIADRLIAIVVNAEKAVSTALKAERLDQDEELALWSLLPAKVRTAIKRGN